MPSLALFVATRLVRLAPVDVVVVVSYFVPVIAIGWSLKGRSNTGEGFFVMAKERCVASGVFTWRS